MAYEEATQAFGIVIAIYRAIDEPEGDQNSGLESK